MKKLSIIICACLAASAIHIADANAQDYKAWRTKTWSIYGQGGVSIATGLDFKNENESSLTSIAPEVGAGVNFNLRPWIRFGLNYEFSKYQREQRFDAFQPVAPTFVPSQGISELVTSEGGIVYRDMWTMYHNVDFTVEFNIMELWKNRKSGRFNLYAGTGFGSMFARGNVYTLGMGFERWEDPNNVKNDLQVSDNWASNSWVVATNKRHNFNEFYVPVLLSAEYDVTPRFTLGLKAQYKALLSSDEMKPEAVGALAVVCRYNILGKRKGYRTNKQKYEEVMNQYGDLQSQYGVSQGDVDKAMKMCERLNAENNALKQQLNDRPTIVVKEEPATRTMDILFLLGGSQVSQEDAARLETLAKELKADEKISIKLVGEASADGNTNANQRLSEARLANVIAILKSHGIDSNRFLSAEAIGDSDKVNQRKVEITISK